MSKEKLADFLFMVVALPTIVFAVFVLLCILLTYGEINRDPYDVECKTKNGVPVFASGTRYCLNSEIFVMKPKGFK